jgi:transcription elongation factor Elf1
MSKYTFVCTRCERLVAIIDSDAKHFQFKAWCKECGKSEPIDLTDID